ncbi:MAG: hypothetical protein JWM34_1483 [Ilumatobacteraceae bacterium]|nr:hypothetical protein [Ilumatobacteraceae bacterium]
MELTVAHVVILVVAGIVGGIVGTAGGITSLISYPALLAVGVPALPANLSNSIAVLGSGLGSTLGSSLELRDHRASIRRYAPVMIAGSVSGAILLLVTPDDIFAWVVPFLVLSATLLFAAQPMFSRGTSSTRRTSSWPTFGTLAMVAVYNGYFGAGSGIVTLLVLLVLVDHDILRANALKNVLLLSADVLPGILFAIGGRVAWTAVAPLTVGTLVGGRIGPVVARVLPRRLLRIGIVVCGLVLSGWLLFRAA